MGGRVRSGRARDNQSNSRQGSGSTQRTPNTNRARGDLLPPSGALSSGPKFNQPTEQLGSGFGPSRSVEKEKVDTHYDDPIGPSISMRPRTARSKNQVLSAMQDDVNDFSV